ncbi:MAG: hypothetical protein ABIY70_06800 [Capsulimonas sp.]|uniref:hypothetical protein n=1 Tax=Capsulimonas sp. TaxID=2494211 RepID=UPI0032633406
MKLNSVLICAITGILAHAAPSIAETPADMPQNALTLEAKLAPVEKYHKEWQSDYAGYAEFDCTVKNVSNKTIWIGTETADFVINWSTDNPNINTPRWPILANLPYGIRLDPGQTYSRAIPLLFGQMKAGDSVTFHLLFHSNPGGALRRIPQPVPDKNTMPDLIASCSIKFTVPK